MASTKQPTLRYGHAEGFTEVCFSDSGEYIISCGHDGEVRVWKDIDDDEPNAITSGEKAYSVATKGSTVYVASDSNAVERYTLPVGESDGILLRFTGNATCLNVSESKKIVAAGSSDFDIKVINTETKKQKCYLGHQAPILSVSIDPNEEFLASTSCDGKLKIWDLQKETCVKTLDVLTKSNDVINSSSLARLCWRPSTGEDVAVALEEGIKIYSRVTWELYHFLTTSVNTKAFQCCNFSPCGRFIAASSVIGWIVIWDAETKDCLQTFQHPMKSFVCSLVWDPRQNNSLAFSDSRGQIGVWTDVIESEISTEKNINDLDALFEEEDDNMMVDLMAEEEKDDVDLPVMKKRGKTKMFESDDEDDVDAKITNDLPPIPSTMEVLARIDDDLDDLPSSLPTAPNDDASSVGGLRSKQRPMVDMQPPFQPGSTPSHLTHRFMVWNSVGLVRAYNDVTENAIDVEFHDARTHHSIHVNNMEKYSMADLSDKALVLACDVTEDSPSKVKCIHFSSWDSNKEWSMEMCPDEEIQAVTIGDCWLAVCTDALQVRLLSLGGVQRQIFSIPGPVVAMVGHTDQLLIAYHVTQGFGNNQCLGFMLVEVGVGSGCKPRNIVGGSPLPISPDSILVWLGFTAEGTPVTVDSKGVIRMFNRQFCGTWTQVADTEKMKKSRHDHYWVVGLHENPQQIRCILCKGATFPATLPRPTLTVLHYSLPLCEMESEKSKLEEEFWRTRLLSSSGDYLTSRGYEPDLEGKKKQELQIQHSLMKLFALCCKTDADFQAVEVCSLMPTVTAVNLAIKYASRLRRIMLAQRLQEVAQDKLEEVRKVVEVSDEEEEEDYRAEMRAGYSTSETEWAPSPRKPRIINVDPAEEDSEAMTSSPQVDVEEVKTKPTRSLSSQLAGSRKNPFKIPNKSASAAPSSDSVLDKIKRPTSSSQLRNSIAGKGKKVKAKETSKPKGTQSTLKMNLTSTPKQKKAVSRTGDQNPPRKEEEVLQEISSNEAPSSASTPAKTGVHLFIDDRLEALREENPDVNGVELRKMAIKMFRSLPAPEKQDWNDRARESNSSSTVAVKRKHDVGGHDVDENAPPTEDLTNEMEAPAKCLKLTDDIDAPPDDVANPRSKLATFAYSEVE